MSHCQSPVRRQVVGQKRRVRGFAVGPLLLIIIVVALFLLWRFVPWDMLLSRVAEGPEQVTSSPPVRVEKPPEPPPPEAIQDSPQKEPGPALVVEPIPPAAMPPMDEGVEPPVVKPPVIQPPITVVPKPVPAAAPKPFEPLVPKPPADSKPAKEETALTTQVRPTEPAQIEPVKAKPNLMVLVEAEVDERAGLGAYGAEQYAAMLKKELEAAVVGALGGEMVVQGSVNLAFREHLMDGRNGMTALCKQAGANRLLLADVRIPSAGFSTIDSAYWPEVSFMALNCVDGRNHRRPSKRLEPHHQDRFEFQYHFIEKAQAFIASQGYFLKP